MSGFTSRWMEWESSKTPIQQTDKADKSPSVSFVSEPPKRLEEKTTPKSDLSSFPQMPTEQTDKTDKRVASDTLRPNGDGWDAEAARLIEWFLTTEPPSQPFELCRAVTVARPDIWWSSLRQDIAEGPNGPRAYTGALQSDLRKLWSYFNEEETQARVTEQWKS